MKHRCVIGREGLGKEVIDTVAPERDRSKRRRGREGHAPLSLFPPLVRGTNEWIHTRRRTTLLPRVSCMNPTEKETKAHNARKDEKIRCRLSGEK